MLALDALRGIAALSVVVAHIGWTMSLSHTGVDRNGYLMVDFFFVLSGFVIALNYREKIAGAADFARFLWLRFFRLYPLHLTMLGVFLLFECVTLFEQTRYGIGGAPAFGLNGAKAFFSQLALVQAFGINADDTFNGPSWSISTEFWTYAVFAVVLILVSRRHLTAAASAIVVLAVSVFLVRHQGLTHSSDRLSEARCLYGFFSGVIACSVYGEWKSAKSLGSRPALAAIAAIILLIVAKPSQLFDLLMPPLSAVLIVSLGLARGSRIGRALTTPPMLFLGKVSYSIYMVHMAVIWLVMQGLRFGLHLQAAPYPGEPDRQLIQVSPLLGDALMLGVIGVVLLLSHVTFTRIEAPLRSWSRKHMPFVRETETTATVSQV